MHSVVETAQLRPFRLQQYIFMFDLVLLPLVAVDCLKLGGYTVVRLGWHTV